MQTEKQKRDERRKAGELSAETEAELVKQSQYFKGNFSRLKKHHRELIDAATTEVKRFEEVLNALYQKRRTMSDALQTWIFEQFQMLNVRGECKNLVEIFAETPQGVPPAGAGECALPKLLQYAFTHGWRPLCFGEFWWGASPRNEVRVEGQFYPSCLSKCKPILAHMLDGLSLDPNPIEALQRSVEDQLAIIYEDESLVAVNKPSGMLSVPGLTGVPSAYELLLTSRPDLMVVHRLDMSTSGVLVFAKTKEAHYELQRQFAEREAKKRYIADVVGSVEQESGLICLPLRLDPLNRPRQVVDHTDGKPAVTHFKKIEERATPNGVITRLALSPQTGRTHQLRLHCAHTEGLGTPIVGDELYGTKADRLHLHAELLIVRHPATGRSLRLTAEPQGM
jgi:tRNA pseudouridine32 synthase/23S rRNA pseudouridine746 synthase